MGIVVSSRALQCKHALAAVVEGNLGQVAKVVIQLVLATGNNSVGIGPDTLPVTSEGTHLGHNGLGGGAGDTASRTLGCRQHLNSLGEVTLDE